MLIGLHHVAIIASSEKSIEFYSSLGFVETERIERGYDTVVMMDGPCTLEIFIDPTHPKRMSNPEAMGLRHLAFKADDFAGIVKRYESKTYGNEIGKRFSFINDPDGLPIEIRE